MDPLKAITKWAEYIKSKNLSKEKEKFLIGHPWICQKEFDDIVNKGDLVIDQKEGDR